MASTLRFDNWENSNGDSIASAVDGFLSSPGNVLQVVSTTKSDTFSASLARPNETAISGLSASITPKSISSKILIIVSVNMSALGPSTSYYSAGGGIKLYRDSTAIFLGNASGSRVPLTTQSIGNPDQYGSGTVNFNGLDLPTTTSSITYSVNAVMDYWNGGTVYVNRTGGDADTNGSTRSSSTITLMEIAG